jgi:hypothetical protein
LPVVPWAKAGPGDERERKRRTHIHISNDYRVIKQCRSSYSLNFREEMWRAEIQ